MKKNVSGQVVGAQMCSATDGSAFTGTVTVYVTGNAGTQAIGSVGSGVCTHEGNGFHTYAPAQSETNYDHVAFTFVGTGAIPSTVQIYTTFPQTGDAFARLGAPAGASVSADVAAVKAETASILADTNELQTDWANGGRLDLILDARASQSSVDTIDGIVDAILLDTAEIGTAGAGLTAVPWNAAWDAEVQSEVADALAVYDPPTSAELNARTLAAADYATAANLATVAGYIDTEVAAIKVVTDRVATTLEAASGSPGEFRFTADALVNAPSASSDCPTAAEIADAVWDEPVTDHLGAGSTGAALNAAGSAGDPWSTPLPGAYGAGTAGAIVAGIGDVSEKLDTTLILASGSPGEYQFTADALELAPAGSGGGGGPSAGAIAAAVWAEALPGAYGSGQAGKIVGDSLDAAISTRASQASLNTVDTVVDAIKAKTDNLPADPADASDIAASFSTVNSSLATLTSYVDTEVAAIKAKTDNLPAQPAAVGDIPTATQNADALLNRDMGAVSDTNARTPLNALRFLRNKWALAGTTLSVKKEDDSTEAWNATVSTSAGADPVTGNDPS